MKDSMGREKGTGYWESKSPLFSPAKRREKKGEEKSGFCLLHR